MSDEQEKHQQINETRQKKLREIKEPGKGEE